MLIALHVQGVGMIELGGNITLNGFDDRDYAELIVTKKIVGRYARQISDSHPGLERLDVVLKTAPGNYDLEASCLIKGVKNASTGADKNLFIALDAVLKTLVNEIK